MERCLPTCHANFCRKLGFIVPKITWNPIVKFSVAVEIPARKILLIIFSIYPHSEPDILVRLVFVYFTFLYVFYIRSARHIG